MSCDWWTGGHVTPILLSDWTDGGIHAREWISPAVALWTLHAVLADPRMVDSLDWFLHPVVNPDGFTFTHEHVGAS